MKTPEFKNLKEERAFWDTHDATDYLDDFEEAPDVVFAREKKAVLSLRLEPKISRKLREMAIRWRFRGKPATDSDPNRPLIPKQIGRAFRSKSATPWRGKVTLDN